jgi:hypothetical protein
MGLAGLSGSIGTVKVYGKVKIITIKYLSGALYQTAIGGGNYLARGSSLLGEVESKAVQIGSFGVEFGGVLRLPQGMVTALLNFCGRRRASLRSVLSVQSKFRKHTSRI